MITRLQAPVSTSNAMPPQVPQTEPVKSKISFRGEDDEFVNQWNNNKRDYEEFENSDNKVLKAVGKTGKLLAAGFLAYGTAKLGLKQVVKAVDNTLKSKQVTNAVRKANVVLKRKLIPFFNKTANSAKESVLFTKASNATSKAAENIKKTKFVTFVNDKANNFAHNEKVSKSASFIKSKAVAMKNKAAEMFGKVKGKFTVANIKNYAIETLSVGSGMAASMTTAGVAAEHTRMDEAA